MSENNHIDLVELPARGADEVAALRAFYETSFGWSFTSYGESYVDTSDSGVTLGVNGSEDDTQQSMPLAVLYVADLEAARDRVTVAGGAIVHEIYPFPGGRRFHFTDPSGNELAAWSQ